MFRIYVCYTLSTLMRNLLLFLLIACVLANAVPGNAQISAVPSTVSTYIVNAGWVDGAPPMQTSFGTLGSMVMDGRGGYYVSSNSASVIYRVSADGRVFRVASGVAPLILGDGGPALPAWVLRPAGMAVDSQGNLFIADTGFQRIRKIDTSGIITSIAGNGTAGFTGDAIPATQASLNFPQAIAVDSSGTVFIADSLNHRVRKIGLDGIITTVAGNGNATYNGDEKPATLASLQNPRGVAVDAQGRLYIADSDNLRVRMVDTQGMIHTVAGGGSSDVVSNNVVATSVLVRPLSVTVGSDGLLYIGGVSRVHKLGADGILHLITGQQTSGIAGDDGPALNASVTNIRSIAFENGNLYLGSELGTVRRVRPDGIIHRVAGGGPSFVLDPAVFNPQAVEVDYWGNVYASDLTRVQGYSPIGGAVTVAGSGAPGQPAFSAVSGITLDAANNVYVSDYLRHRVYKSQYGSPLVVIAGTGTAGVDGDGGPAAQAGIHYPRGLALDPEGNLYISDSGNHRIRKVSATGIISTVAGTGVAGYSGDGGPGHLAQIGDPRDIALDVAGNLYIADGGNQRIRRLAVDGTITTVAGNGDTPTAATYGGPALASPVLPTGLAVDSSSGAIYFTDRPNGIIGEVYRGVVRVVAGMRTVSGFGDGGPPLAASFSLPNDIAVDATGNLYIADSNSSRIRRITIDRPSLSYGTLTNAGVVRRTPGSAPDAVTGHARVHANSGSSPEGVAIFSLRQNNVLISEASVLASPPILSGAVFAEATGSVQTGIAIANPNPYPVTVRFFLMKDGQMLGTGTTRIIPYGQISAFLDQPPFYRTFSGGALFEFVSQAPVSVVAFRGLINGRGEFLLTTVPVANMNAPPTTSPAYFPHFADGGGWESRITLINPGSSPISGKLEFRNTAGNLAGVMVNAQLGGVFSYSIPAHGFQQFQTAGIWWLPLVSGSVHIVPDPGSPTPSGVLLFSMSRETTIAEASIAAVPGGRAFRLYVEGSGNFVAGAPGSIETGFTVANTSGTTATVSFGFTHLDGSASPVAGLFTIPPGGQTAMFLNQLPGFNGVVKPVRGILRLTSNSDISVTGIRGRYNERNEFLVAVTPAVNEAVAVPAGDLLFPLIVDSGGYTTEVILFNPRSSASQGTLQLFSRFGQGLDLGMQ